MDDERRLAEALRLSLATEHDVHVETQGRKALELLVGSGGPATFDVILCDMLMPDLAGHDLYEQVAMRRPEMAERFVFLTGGAFTDSTRAFLQRVPNPRIEKPFDLDALEKLVDERVRFARSLR